MYILKKVAVCGHFLFLQEIVRKRPIYTNHGLYKLFLIQTGEM